jgi:Flp pilus assembly protein TadD
MKRPVLWGIALFLAAAGSITVLKFRPPEASRAVNAADAVAQARLALFWETYNRAGVLRTQGQFGPAAADYRQALRINPNHEDSLYYLATCQYEMGEYEAAEAELRQLIRLKPESGRAYGQLGRLLSSRSPGAPTDLAAARQAFERQLVIYQEQAGPLLELGQLELNQGELARAEAAFRTAVALGSPEAKFLTGYVLYLQKRPAEARSFFRSVLEAYWADRKSTAKGILSEGDVLPAAGKPLTALQRAALQSALFSYWVDLEGGAMPQLALEALHLHDLPATPPLLLASDNSGGHDWTGRAAWVSSARGGVQLAAGGTRLTLYRLQAGKLMDITQAAGLGGVRQVWEPYWADFDGNGFADLYLVRPGFNGTGQNLLYRQDRDGRFRNETVPAGLSGPRSTIRACFADFDGDGRLDLLEVGAAADGQSSVRLFRNTGTQFVNVTDAAGLKNNSTAVDCTVADFEGDGRPDLFVQFWRRDAILYRNHGAGRFEDVTSVAGLQGVRGGSLSSMVFDYDRDGRPDLLVTYPAPLEEVARSVLEPNAQAQRATPRLFRNRGNGAFQETTAALGLRHAYGTIQALAADLDSDGWTDLLLISGSPDARVLAPSVLLHNLAGQRFEERLLAPAGTVAGNFLGGTMLCAGEGGSCRLYLAPHPVLRRQHAGGLFHLSLTPPSSERVAAAKPTGGRPDVR